MQRSPHSFIVGMKLVGLNLSVKWDVCLLGLLGPLVMNVVLLY